MIVSDIVTQLVLLLPPLTPEFTKDVNITGITSSGTTATATTAEAHEFVQGAPVAVSGADTPIAAASGGLTRLLTIGTLVTDTDHDLTKPSNRDLDITISGATQDEYNGTFAVIQIVNRRTIKFTMEDAGASPATGSPILHGAESAFRGYNGIFQVLNVPSPNSFTYTIQNAIPTAIGSAIVARGKPRIAAAVDLKSADEAYTKQLTDDWWLFVSLDNVGASKSRNIQSDATDNQPRNSEYRQQIIQPFTLYLFIPTKDELAARAARDDAEQMFRNLCKSLLFSSFDSQLFVGNQGTVQFTRHGSIRYMGTYYIHGYSFEQTVDLTFDDTVGEDVSVALRDIIYTLGPDFGTEDEILGANVDLDDTPL